MGGEREREEREMEGVEGHYLLLLFFFMLHGSCRSSSSSCGGRVTGCSRRCCCWCLLLLLLLLLLLPLFFIFIFARAWSSWEGRYYIIRPSEGAAGQSERWQKSERVSERAARLPEVPCDDDENNCNTCRGGGCRSPESFSRGRG